MKVETGECGKGCRKYAMSGSCLWRLGGAFFVQLSIVLMFTFVLQRKNGFDVFESMRC